ncbi:MAG: M23 family metallopeptidase, partial [Micrococcales bacterium]
MTEPCLMTPKLLSPRFLPFLFLLCATLWLIEYPDRTALAATPSITQKSATVRLAADPGEVWLVPIPIPALEVRQYEQSLTPYSTGHRGIDYSVQTNTVISAPANGTLAFSGQVGGKPVVAIEHENGYRTAFEPACSDVPVGTPLLAGEP